MSRFPQYSKRNALVAAYATNAFGSRSLQRLERHFPDCNQIFTASNAQLQAAGVRPKAAATFVAARSNINLEALYADLERRRIAVVTWHDAAYPPLLKELPDLPPVLFVRGNPAALAVPGVAIVGARKTTAYGERAAKHLARELAAHSISIVSGLALGIDAHAHRGALEAGGATVAVLGSGLDNASIYPRANFTLAREIVAAGGALISEHLPGTPGLPHHFPRRNRIVAGLSRATVVVEAGEKSGALITARLALDYNREVLAVPGSIFSAASAGTHALLREGAAVAATAEDILTTTGMHAAPATATPPPLTADEARIYQYVSGEPTHINTLVRLTKLDTAGLNATLSVMEIKGIVRNMGGGNYTRT